MVEKAWGDAAGAHMDKHGEVGLSLGLLQDRVVALVANIAVAVMLSGVTHLRCRIKGSALCRLGRLLELLPTL